MAAGTTAIGSYLGAAEPDPVQLASICDVDPVAFATFLRVAGDPEESRGGDSGLPGVEECSHAWGSADDPGLVVDVSRGPSSTDVERVLRAGPSGADEPGEAVDLGDGLTARAVDPESVGGSGVLGVVCSGGGHAWRLRAATTDRTSDLAAGLGDLARALGCRPAS